MNEYNILCLKCGNIRDHILSIHHLNKGSELFYECNKCEDIFIKKIR